MKAVAIVGEEMKEGNGGCDGEEDCCVDAALAGVCMFVCCDRRQNCLLTGCSDWLRRRGGAGFVALAGLRDADGGHAGGGCALNAHVGVFKDEAVSGRDAEAGGGGEEGIGSGLGARVVL